MVTMTSLRIVKFIIGYLLFQRFILGTEETPLPDNKFANTDDDLLRIHFLLKNYSKLPKDNLLPYYVHLVLPTCTILKTIGYTLGSTGELKMLNLSGQYIPRLMKNCDVWAWTHDLINMLILVCTIFLICCQIAAQEYLVRTRIRIKESKGYKSWIIINALLNGLINGLLIILILLRFKNSVYCI